MIQYDVKNTFKIIGLQFGVHKISKSFDDLKIYLYIDIYRNIS